MIAYRIAVILALVALSAPALADPPKVVKATPDNGDTDVDPALTEIRIEFDQDMDVTGHSLCGGGPAFPTLSGKLAWKSKRLIVVPVVLKPDHQYSFMVNCPAAQNFRSAAGESAEIYPISFKTRKGKEAATPKLSREENLKTIEALRKAIDEKYAYRDLRKVDWAKAFEEFKPRMESAETPAAFGRAAAALLEKAKDLHCTVHVGEQVLATHKRAVTPNVRAETLEKVVSSLQKVNEVVWTGVIDGEVGYINILSWAADDMSQFDALDEAVDALRDRKAIIVDVRFNSGGDELAARKFAANFVKRKAVYSRNTYRDPAGENGFTKPIERAIEPRKDRKPYEGKVAVLMGIANMSSCESFILMMKTASNVRTFGEKSYGSSGNPKPHEISDSITVYLSSWQDIMPGGRLLEGNGITPDQEVKTKSTDFAKDDQVLKAALEWTRAK